MTSKVETNKNKCPHEVQCRAVVAVQGFIMSCCVVLAEPRIRKVEVVLHAELVPKYFWLGTSAFTFIRLCQTWCVILKKNLPFHPQTPNRNPKPLVMRAQLPATPVGQGTRPVKRAIFLAKSSLPASCKLLHL